MEEKIIIKLENLPARAEKLSPDEVTTVFGGCATKGVECDKGGDCCGDLVCWINWPLISVLVVKIMIAHGSSIFIQVITY